MAIYLDHNATTAPHARVVDALVAVLRAGPANASSRHGPGRAAREAVERARLQVAALLGASADEIVFTGSGTEADNLALLGTLAAHGDRGHVVVSGQEHHAVLHAAELLGQRGVEVTLVPPDGEGRVSAAAVKRALREDTVLVSVMHANNETGVIQPIAEIAAAAHARGALLHTDAVQTVGKVPIDVESLEVDLLSLSAHKFHGPQGVGALYVRDSSRLRPRVVGGGQEDGLRAGTYNLAGIVGLGEAARIAQQSQREVSGYVEAMRAHFEEHLLRRVPEASVIGARVPRLANTSLVAFPERDGAALVAALDGEGIAVSTGAACTTGLAEPSHVLRAMALPPEMARGAVRFSLGPENTEEEMDVVVRVLGSLLGRRTGGRTVLDRARLLVPARRRMG